MDTSGRFISTTLGAEFPASLDVHGSPNPPSSAADTPAPQSQSLQPRERARGGSSIAPVVQRFGWAFALMLIALAALLFLVTSPWARGLDGGSLLRAFGWLSALAVAAAAFAYLLRDWRSYRLHRQRIVEAVAPLEARILALEKRLEQAGAVTQSIAIGAEENTQTFDEHELERVLRRSLIIQLGDKPNMDPASMLAVLQYLRGSANTQDKPTFIGRATPWITTFGTGVAALVALVGLLSSIHILDFDGAPKVTAIKPLRSRITSGGELDIDVDAEDPERGPLTYTFTANTGTITSIGKLATLRAPHDSTTRSGVANVIVRDAKGHEATGAVAIRVNRNPMGASCSRPHPRPASPHAFKPRFPMATGTRSRITGSPNRASFARRPTAPSTGKSRPPPAPTRSAAK